MLDRTLSPSLLPAAALADPQVAPVQWVFAYGSLIWNPCFEYTEMHLGRVHGYHRAFCIRSTLYRGTPEQPGIVLGLDRGGSCIGMLFRLDAPRRSQGLAALYEREMGGDLYEARQVVVSTRTGDRVHALAFVANPRSAHYERLSDDDILQRLTRCRGQRGPNHEYALMTWRSLQAHAVDCPHLARLGRRLLAAVEPSDNLASSG